MGKEMIFDILKFMLHILKIGLPLFLCIYGFVSWLKWMHYF